MQIESSIRSKAVLEVNSKVVVALVLLFVFVGRERYRVTILKIGCIVDVEVNGDL
jgi:hypothetical protein